MEFNPETNIELVKKVCIKCGNLRKFLKDTPRDHASICGNCWDWSQEPVYIKLTPKQAEKLKELLKE